MSRIVNQTEIILLQPFGNGSYDIHVSYQAKFETVHPYVVRCNPAMTIFAIPRQSLHRLDGLIFPSKVTLIVL